MRGSSDRQITIRFVPAGYGYHTNPVPTINHVARHVALVPVPGTGTGTRVTDCGEICGTACTARSLLGRCLLLFIIMGAVILHPV